ncbi:MAG: acyl-CoA thioesterase [Thermoplasmatota archaeon]
MGFRFRHEVRARWRDLDSMGHVNHAVYLTYMEEARIAYFTALFGSAEKAMAAGLGVPGRRREPFEFVIAHADVDYRRPASLGDAIVVSCGTTRIGTTSFDIGYLLADTENRTIAEGRTVQVFIGADGRPRPVPEALHAAIERYDGPLPGNHR